MAKIYFPAVLERGKKGMFGVWFPDFPDCVAAERSQEQAIQKSEMVLAHAVDALFERDQPLPKPTPIESIPVPRGCDLVAFFLVGVEPPDPSERVNIYLPKSLIQRADKRAAELGMSRSSFFGLAVSAATGMLQGLTLPGLVQPRTKAERSGGLRQRKLDQKR